MATSRRSMAALLLVVALVGGCASSTDGGASTTAGAAPKQAVVIVSGGDAVSPFTTPEQACATGLAAGNTDTALREYLLKQGRQVYTSPAMNARGPVVEQDGFGAFGGCPVVLPEWMTVNSTADIDLAGVHLGRFLQYLQETYGITDVDLVGHSMGGLFSRAAIRDLSVTNSTIHIDSLTTIGTPWQGSLLADFASGAIGLDVCQGATFCEKSLEAFKERTAQVQIGASQEVTDHYLDGTSGWEAFQAGVLDNIPVTLIGGRYFDSVAGDARYWPNDGIVALSSALAVAVPSSVLPRRTCHTVHDTHSIFVSEAAKADWSTALTWDPAVLKTVDEALSPAGIQPTATATGTGCPGT